MAYDRDDLITEALANLGIVRLPEVGGTRTRIELVAKAAQTLGVLPSGQTLSAEDSANIDVHVDSVIADLNTHAIVTISDANAIPIGMFDALADIVANAAKSSYEEGGAATTQLATDAMAARLKLYAFGGAPIVDRNLDAIYAELSADDLVSLVDDSDIPQEWFLSLAAIVADKLKGKFPLVPPDVIARVQAAGMEAVQTLRRTTRGRPSYNRSVPEWI